MELRPIISAMLRNKTGVILVALQIAIALAVVTNAVFIIMQRVEKINRPTGIDTDNLVFVQSYGFGADYDQRETVRRDLALLRSLPGVVAASVTNGVPLSNGGSASGYRKSADAPGTGVGANYYEVDEQGIAAFGAKLIAGRAFRVDEVQYDPTISSAFVPSVIMTRDMAKDLFGDENAVGKTVFDSLGQPATVVGVIDNMLNAWIDDPKATHVVFHPRIPTGVVARYMVRTEPGQVAALVPQIEQKLAELNPSRAITTVRPHSVIVKRSYQPDSRMITFLATLVGLMIAVTALGIVGLASFHVRVRTKQIGTRRAIGARRRDILRYFLLENLVLTVAGLVIGTVLAFAFGQWLSAAYSLPRLDPRYVVAGIAILAVLGQLAVLPPARRAMRIPPAIATRTV